MSTKLWVVVRTRHTTDNDSTIICGLYEDFGDAVARVAEVFNEDFDTFEEVYGNNPGFDADNHNNGFAELHYGDSDYDDINIIANEYEINKSTFELL